jgi:hypothetical protein
MNYTVDEKKVIYADLDPTEGVVLNLDTKNYYRLNETGQVIWQAVAARKTPEEIADLLVEDFDVDRETAMADVKKMFERFEDEQLISVAGEKRPPIDVERARAAKRGRTAG